MSWSCFFFYKSAQLTAVLEMSHEPLIFDVLNFSCTRTTIFWGCVKFESNFFSGDPELFQQRRVWEDVCHGSLNVSRVLNKSTNLLCHYQWFLIRCSGLPLSTAHYNNRKTCYASCCFPLDQFTLSNRYGQMTAGSYCYIGPQGIVHGTTVSELRGHRYIPRSSWGL